VVILQYCIQHQRIFQQHLVAVLVEHILDLMVDLVDLAVELDGQVEVVDLL